MIFKNYHNGVVEKIKKNSYSYTVIANSMPFFKKIGTLDL